MWYRLIVSWLRLWDRFLTAVGVARDVKLPVAAGAKNGKFRIAAYDQTPVLFSGGLPYPTFFDTTSHAGLPLRGTWHMRFDPEEHGERERWFESIPPHETVAIPIPSTYNSFRSGFVGHVGIVWFFHAFRVDTPSHRIGLDPDGVFARLCFEGVLSRCTVWLNGEFVGNREGGYTPFYFDITERLRNDRENLIVVKSDNRLSYTTLPPKNRRNHTHPWGIYGGIYRDVYVEFVPRQYVFKVACEAILDRGPAKLWLTVGVHNHGIRRPYTLTLRLLSPGDRQIGSRTIEAKNPDEIDVHRTVFDVADPILWSIQSPALYRVAVRLNGGEHTQDVSVLAGMRSVEAADGKILLNGKTVFLRGISYHESDPDLGASQTAESVRRDYDLIQKMNANYVRTAHYPHSPVELCRARDAGVLLSEEIPYYIVGTGFIQWFEEGCKPFGFPWRRFGSRHLRNRELLLNAQQCLAEMIERDRNNPAIIMWSVGNECYTLTERAARVFDWLKKVALSFDRTRLVTTAEVTYDIPALDDARLSAKYMDVVSLNAYYGWFYGEPDEIQAHVARLAERFPGKPIILSEFGADAALGRTDGDGAFSPRDGDVHAAYGVRGKTFSEDYQIRLYGTYFDVATHTPSVAGMSPWIFADIYHPSPWFTCSLVPHYNLKGVVTRERQPKRVFYELQRMYSNLKE